MSKKKIANLLYKESTIFEVYFYGIRRTFKLKRQFLYPDTPDNKRKYGKKRNSNSQYKDDFAKALSEMENNPDDLPESLIQSQPVELSTQSQKQVADQERAENIDTFQFLPGGIPIKRVPKGARIPVAIALTDLIRKVTSNVDSKEAWMKLLHFPSLCLAKPKRGGKKRKSITSHINGLVRDFTQGIPTKDRATHTNTKKKTASIAGLVSTKLSMFDIRGAVCILASISSIISLKRCLSSNLL